MRRGAAYGSLRLRSCLIESIVSHPLFGLAAFEMPPYGTLDFEALGAAQYHLFAEFAVILISFAVRREEL